MLRYLVLGAIFYVMVPGILLSLPKGGSKKMTALTHAIVFVGAYYLAEKLAEKVDLKRIEGFRSMRAPTASLSEGKARKQEVQQRQERYDQAALNCKNARKAKDEYSSRFPLDQAKKYHVFNKRQDAACDDMNDAANKLHDMGVATTFSWW